MRVQRALEPNERDNLLVMDPEIVERRLERLRTACAGTQRAIALERKRLTDIESDKNIDEQDPYYLEKLTEEIPSLLEEIRKCERALKELEDKAEHSEPLGERVPVTLRENDRKWDSKYRKSRTNE